MVVCIEKKFNPMSLKWMRKELFAENFLCTAAQNSLRIHFQLRELKFVFNTHTTIMCILMQGILDWIFLVIKQI